MRRIATLGLILLLLCGASPLPAGSAPLRTIDYAVTAKENGVPFTATVRVAFTGGDSRSEMLVDVSERIDDEDRIVSNVRIGRNGAIGFSGAMAMTMEVETIVALLALESENMNGVERGDRWTRDAALPGGTHRAAFAVLGAPVNGLIPLSVVRSVALDDGSVGDWRGTLTYNARAVVPATIALTGTLRAGSNADEPLRDVSLAIRLTNDSFTGR